MNCWQGVFELKNKKVPVGAGTVNKNINVNPNICNSRRKYTQNCIVKQDRKEDIWNLKTQ